MVVSETWTMASQARGEHSSVDGCLVSSRLITRRRKNIDVRPWTGNPQHDVNDGSMRGTPCVLGKHQSLGDSPVLGTVFSSQPAIPPLTLTLSKRHIDRGRTEGEQLKSPLIPTANIVRGQHHRMTHHQLRRRSAKLYLIGQ